MNPTILLGNVLGEKGYIRGPFGSALRRPEMKKSGIPVYEQQNAIYNNRTFRFFIDEKKYTELQRFTVKPGDLVISCSGTLGKITVIKEGDPIGIISQALLILRPDTKKVSSSFLYYFLTSPTGQSSLLDASHGSVQTNIAKREVVSAIKLSLPGLDEQQKIVSVLEKIDEKVELNNQINQTLTATIQKIFKNWFVDFEFPKVNIIHQESLQGSMPEDWKMTKVGEVILTIESGSRPKGGAIETGIPSIGAENIEGLGAYNYSKEKFVSEDYFAHLNRGKVMPEDVVLYKDGAYVGKKSLFMDSFPHKVCCVNEHVFILRTNKNLPSQFYLYFWLDQERITKEIINAGVKAAQPGINQEDVKGLPILLPDKATIESFDRLVSPLMEQIFNNANQSKTLLDLKGLLLPQLISGKIKL